MKYIPSRANNKHKGADTGIGLSGTEKSKEDHRGNRQEIRGEGGSWGQRGNRPDYASGSSFISC